MSKIKRFGVSISEDMVDQFDLYVEKKGYPTRSKAFEDRPVCSITLGNSNIFILFI